MSSFWTVASADQPSQHIVIPGNEHGKPDKRSSNFLQFLAICLGDQRYRIRGLHPVLTNASPSFSDVSTGGTSFDVRKVLVSSFPHGLDGSAFKSRKFVAVKQPRPSQAQSRIDPFHEIIQELQIPRDERVQQHPNIINLIGVVYHDASDQSERSEIVPALVVEFAELGDLRSYLADGIEYTVQAGYDICLSIASGLQCLHKCGIIHCDIKDTNILVCLDENNNPIVKISDFGFALSLCDEDPQLVGYTHHWEAPEVHKPLMKHLLPQIDIYSYGLLFYTVLKKGSLFYQALPTMTEGDVLRLKNSNMLHELFQLNLLNTMNNERCLLLCFCRIIRYCLQADNEQRFGSMKDIIQHLELSNPSNLVPEKHVGEPLYRRMQMPVAYFYDSEEGIHKAFASTFESYKNSWSTPLHLGTALEDALEKRFCFETDMLLQRPPTEFVERYWCCPYFTLCVYSSMQGLFPYKQILPELDSKNMIHISRKIALDLQAYGSIVLALHSTVKRFLFTELEAVEENGCGEIVEACYNKAYCHIEGVGTERDVSTGLGCLMKAANLGSERAQLHLVRMHTANRELSQTPEFLRWCSDVLGEEDKQALEVLRKLDPRTAKRLQHNWASERAIDLDDIWFRGLQDNDDVLISPCESSTWRAKFIHLASAMGMDELVFSLIHSTSNLLDTVNRYGQTPLIIACQNGQIRVAKVLLENGADVNAQDVNGISALHWIISFVDVEKEELLSLFVGHVSTVDLFAKISDSRTPNLRGSPSVSGTPLHWAVICRDISAVRILLDLGASPSARVSFDTRSPLELACSIHTSSIVKLMLSNLPADAATRYQPLSGQGDGLEVNLMFWVVSGVNTYQSLLRCGSNYENEIQATVGSLVRAGTAVESVLRHSERKMAMSAPFATSLHRCHAEIMKAGIKNGFSRHMDTTFGSFSSGGPALSLAIAHHDRDMFTTLLEAGASIKWRNRYGVSALGTVAKETDDPWFVLKLLEKGALIDDPEDTIPPFYIATYSGNLTIARLLWEKGAKRDARDTRGLTVLGALIGMRTRNAGKFIAFILSLPDRDEGDGFVPFNGSGHSSSAFHLTLVPNDGDQVMAEDPEMIETSRLVTTMLIEKYSDTKYLNNKTGPHHDIALGMAVECGNHPVVRIFLEAGADPNAEDEYSRRPMDKLLWRYFYPATLDYIKNCPQNDRELHRRLSYVNQNTSEILSLLKSYGAESNVFRYPSWHQTNPGYRELDWIKQRLQENRARSPVPSNVPIWGGLPITIPERPMQFTELESRERLRNEQEHGKEAGN